MRQGAAGDAVRISPPDSTLWPDAALVGFASSMRTLSGPALLAARGRAPAPGRYGPAPWRAIFLVAAAGELLVDKASFATDRTDPGAVIARIVSGGVCGRQLAGWSGLLVGGTVAGLGTFATYRTRKFVVERTGLPDRVVALAEDLAAYGLAARATRDLRAARG